MLQPSVAVDVYKDKSLPHYHSSLIVKTFGIQNSGCLLRSKPQPEAQHGAVLEDRPIQDGSHINVKHIYGVSQSSYAVDVHVDESLQCHQGSHCYHF